MTEQTELVGVEFKPTNKTVINKCESVLGPLYTLPRELQEAFERSKQHGLLKAMGLGEYCVVKLHNNLIKLGLKEDGDTVESFIVNMYGDEVWVVCDDLLNYWMKNNE